MGFPIRGQDWSAARLEGRLDLLCREVFIRHNCPPLFITNSPVVFLLTPKKVALHAGYQPSSFVLLLRAA